MDISFKFRTYCNVLDLDSTQGPFEAMDNATRQNVYAIKSRYAKIRFLRCLLTSVQLPVAFLNIKRLLTSIWLSLLCALIAPTEIFTHSDRHVCAPRKRLSSLFFRYGTPGEQL